MEFPEARIYEETLNVFLYEHLTGPDQELLQAITCRGEAPSRHCTSDDEEPQPLPRAPQQAQAALSRR